MVIGVADHPGDVHDQPTGGIAMRQNKIILKNPAQGNATSEGRPSEPVLTGNRSDYLGYSRNSDNSRCKNFFLFRTRRHASIAKTLKRTEGATRQKAFSLGLSLDSRA